MDGSEALKKKGGGVMALRELERLTDELEYLAELLKAETKLSSRIVILERVQEIVDSIGKGIENE
jgi:hypothetical protein